MAAIDDVRARLGGWAGRLLASDCAGFEDVAPVVFAGDGAAPALVARPRDAGEVAAAVRAAAETGVPFAVRGGGHAYARYGTVAAGLVLDLRLLGGARIDPGRRVGVASAGTTAGDYTAAAAAHGLATGFGDTLSVGVPGLALGGGIGYLSRRDGLTLDNVLGAEVVLADGSIVRASDDENADLFWALRGGGGNFGVVTRLDLRLTPTTVVTGGLLAFAPDPTTVGALLAAAAAAPDELSLMVNVMKAPPAPFLPAERHGTPIVVALVCHSGSPDVAGAVLAPFRAAGTLLVDLVRPQPYPDLFGLAPNQVGTWPAQRTGFVETVAEDAAAAVIDAVRTAPTPVAVLNLRPMGGAIARVPRDGTSFAHRDRAVMATVGAVSPAGAGAADARAWVARAADGLSLGGAAYANFVAEPGAAAASDAYPSETLRRLQEVKRQVDPGNLFRSNLNVLPAEAPAAVRA
ncbi:FAD-binding oxidoreductase [Luteimicrobium sp. NPDC057192]|uniref:FAD-binding oxidoreductase n=1 Tax=Luteimicrobium sp. NPDC057192 TaxID=3346042 RepID=UPI0036430D03